MGAAVGQAKAVGAGAVLSGLNPKNTLLAIADAISGFGV
jgi:hypothetical protein